MHHESEYGKGDDEGRGYENKEKDCTFLSEKHGGTGRSIK